MVQLSRSSSLETAASVIAQIPRAFVGESNTISGSYEWWIVIMSPMSRRTLSIISCDDVHGSWPSLCDTWSGACSAWYASQSWASA